MKRITILLTAIAIIALFLAGCTNLTDDAEKTTDAVTTGPVVEANLASDFEYIENEDGNIVIKRYVGDVTDVVIPETIDGKTVTEIGSNSFSNNYKLISVTIPNTVINIQNSAFYQCAFLVEINLPENLRSIGAGAFEGCSKLSTITLPSSLESLLNAAFKNCSALTHIRIPKSITRWGFDTFMDSGLETIEFEGGLSSIGDTAFAGTNISEVVLPGSIEAIGDGAFGACSNFESVTLSEGIISIGDHAFGGVSKLTEIVIPKSVKNITEFAFSGCGTLEKVVFEGDAPEGYIYPYEEMPIEPLDVNYTVYYYEGAEGFTSPEWNGYKSAVIENK